MQTACVAYKLFPTWSLRPFAIPSPAKTVASVFPEGKRQGREKGEDTGNPLGSPEEYHQLQLGGMS